MTDSTTYTRLIAHAEKARHNWHLPGVAAYLYRLAIQCGNTEAEIFLAQHRLAQCYATRLMPNYWLAQDLLEQLARSARYDMSNMASDEAKLRYARVAFDLAAVYLLCGEIARAENCLEQVRRIFKQHGSIVEEARVRALSAKVYLAYAERSHDHYDFKFHLRQAHRMLDNALVMLLREGGHVRHVLAIEGIRKQAKRLASQTTTVNRREQRARGQRCTHQHDRQRIAQHERFEQYRQRFEELKQGRSSFLV